MSELVETAGLLTREHTRRTTTEDGEVYGTEPALLDILRGLVTPSGAGNGGSDGGGSGGGSRPPISLDALDLWQSITRIVDTCWPGNGDAAYVRVPLAIKLNAWVVHTTDPAAEATLLTLCRRWVVQIREAIEPSKRMPLTGACPVCDKTHVELIDEEGLAKYKTALWAYPDAVPVYAQCMVCEARWENGQLHDLGAHLVTLESAFTC